MNGARLKAMRKSMGIAVKQLADLLDASQAGVHRWEGSPDHVFSPTTHQERVLALLDTRTDAALRQLGDLVRMRGGLYGLYALLRDEFGDLPKDHRLPRVQAETTRAAS